MRRSACRSSRRCPYFLPGIPTGSFRNTRAWLQRTISAASDWQRQLCGSKMRKTVLLIRRLIWALAAWMDLHVHLTVSLECVPVAMPPILSRLRYSSLTVWNSENSERIRMIWKRRTTFLSRSFTNPNARLSANAASRQRIIFPTVRKWAAMYGECFWAWIPLRWAGLSVAAPAV